MEKVQDSISDAVDVCIYIGNGGGHRMEVWLSPLDAYDFCVRVQKYHDGFSSLECLHKGSRYFVRHAFVNSVYWSMDEETLEVQRNAVRMGHQRFLLGSQASSQVLENERLNIEEAKQELEKRKQALERSKDKKPGFAG